MAQKTNAILARDGESHDRYVEIRELSKSFYDDETASEIDVLGDFSLSVDEGEFITMFGPNGCGKTTLLHILAGALAPNSGSVEIGGRPPSQAKVGLVFQNYRDALFPWRNVLQNVAFPLEVAGVVARDRAQRVRDLLARLRIELPLDAYPYELSGGEQQMVSIARGLVDEPDLLLMDEPFSALDYGTRRRLQDKLLEIWNATKRTIIFVSHEADEAIYLAQRLLLLSRRPARIIASFETGLGPPPRRDSLLSDSLQKLRQQVIRKIEEEMEP